MRIKLKIFRSFAVLTVITSTMGGVGCEPRKFLKIIRAKENSISDVIDKKAIYNTIITLNKERKCNPVLIGEAGVGKDFLVKSLNAQSVKSDWIKGKKIYSLRLTKMMGEAKNDSEFVVFLKKIIEWCQQNKDAILYIRDLDTLFEKYDVKDILKPAMARKDFKMISTMTRDAFKKHVEIDGALARRFDPILLGIPSSDQTTSILRKGKDYLTINHKNLNFSLKDTSLVATAKLSNGYIKNMNNPLSSIRILDNVMSSIVLNKSNDYKSNELLELEEKIKRLQIDNEIFGEAQSFQAIRIKNSEKLKQLEKRLAKMQSINEKRQKSAKNLGNVFINENSVRKEVSKITGIPLDQWQDNGRLVDGRGNTLEDRVKSRMAGQKDAVKLSSKAMIRMLAGMSRPGQPIGSFLFLGPTGTGKTELAKAISKEYLKGAPGFLRIDMSEYSTRHCIPRLIGGGHGSRGGDKRGDGESDVGVLTGHMRKYPFSVILFDEIEKAYVEILPILLQVLDEGRLNDGKGNPVDFTNSIIILTSNIGQEYILNNPQRNKGKQKEECLEHIKKLMIESGIKPELINRIDEIIPFDPLGHAELVKICGWMVDSVKHRARLLVDEVDLQVHSSVIDQFSKSVISYDEYGVEMVNELGARPLKRFIENNLSMGITEMILKQKLCKKCKLMVTAKDIKGRPEGSEGKPFAFNDLKFWCSGKIDGSSSVENVLVNPDTVDEPTKQSSSHIASSTEQVDAESENLTKSEELTSEKQPSKDDYKEVENEKTIPNKKTQSFISENVTISETGILESSHSTNDYSGNDLRDYYYWKEYKRNKKIPTKYFNVNCSKK